MVYFWNTMRILRMKYTTVQTKKVQLAVKEKAEAYAKKAGYTSLQDVIRLFIIDLAKGRFPLGVNWGDALDPEVQESIDQIKKGNFKVIRPDQSISEVLND